MPTAAVDPARPGFGRRVLDLVVIVRLPSCVAGAVSVLLGAHLADAAPGSGPLRLVTASTAILFAVAFANVVNDIVDLPVDAISKPGRPLPSGRMSMGAARVLAAGVALTSIVLAAALGLAAGLWMVALIVAAAAYSFWFKNSVLLGNIVVAACASSPIAFGAVVAGSAGAAVAVATGLTFLFMLSYETLKTLVDHDGDLAGGLRTFATTFGPRASVLLFRALIGALTVLAGAAVTISPTPWAYAAAVTVTFVIPSWWAMFLLRANGRVADMRMPVLLMRFAWFLGIIALWLLR